MEAQRLIRILLQMTIQGLLVIWTRVVTEAEVLRKFRVHFESRTNEICWYGCEGGIEMSAESLAWSLEDWNCWNGVGKGTVGGAGLGDWVKSRVGFWTQKVEVPFEIQVGMSSWQLCISGFKAVELDELS